MSPLRMELTSSPLAASSGNSPPGRWLICQNRKKIPRITMRIMGQLDFMNLGIFGIMKAMLLDKLNLVLSSEKPFISEPLNSIPIALSLLTNIIHWAILASKIKGNTGNIVLHYNVIYGADLIDKSTMIYVIPAVALVIFLVNLALANYFFKREKLAAFFLNFSTIIVQLIFLAASLSLIRINE